MKVFSKFNRILDYNIKFGEKIMPAKKVLKSEKIKTILYVVLAGIAIVGAIIGVNNYFAKTEDIEIKHQLIDERLDIAIIDDQIFQQEQQIQRIENFRMFEQKTVEPELTLIEKEVIEKNRERLVELKDKKADKIKRYEEKR